MPVRAFRFDGLDQRHDFFFSDRNGPWTLGSWASDAKFLACSYVTPGEVPDLILCQASFLEFGGRQLFRSKQQVTHWEWSSTEDASGMSPPDVL